MQTTWPHSRLQTTLALWLKRAICGDTFTIILGITVGKWVEWEIGGTYNIIVFFPPRCSQASPVIGVTFFWCQACVWIWYTIYINSSSSLPCSSHAMLHILFLYSPQWSCVGVTSVTSAQHFSMLCQYLGSICWQADFCSIALVYMEMHRHILMIGLGCKKQGWDNKTRGYGYILVRASLHWYIFSTVYIPNINCFFWGVEGRSSWHGWLVTQAHCSSHVTFYKSF